MFEQHESLHGGAFGSAEKGVGSHLTTAQVFNSRLGFVASILRIYSYISYMSSLNFLLQKKSFFPGKNVYSNKTLCLSEWVAQYVYVSQN